MELNHQAITYDEAIYYLRRFISLKEFGEEEIKTNITYNYQEEEEKKDIITLPQINPNVMDMFLPMSHPLWLSEGIDSLVQHQFNIRFSYLQNKIIIPHYDINGRLVGIRGRAIDEEDLVIRYGGDEFQILSLNVDPEYWENMRDKINAEITANVEQQKLPYQLGASLGYAICNEQHPMTFEECCEKADQAKAAGAEEAVSHSCICQLVGL